jgi:glycosyltransferase involved in cell wall biosynthesis
MKKISIVSSCYNEEGNVEELYLRVKSQMDLLKDKYTYEQILVDNCSTDGTAQKLRELAARDTNVKVIFNSRNFGHIRSPYWAIINGGGDAIIYMASDLQDPPELIPQFIQKWEEGYRIDKNFLFVSWSIFSRLLYVKNIWATRYRRWII